MWRVVYTLPSVVTTTTVAYCENCRAKPRISGFDYCSDVCMRDADRKAATLKRSASQHSDGRYGSGSKYASGTSPKTDKYGLCENCHRRSKRVEHNSSKGQTIVHPYCSTCSDPAKETPPTVIRITDSPPPRFPVAEPYVKQSSSSFRDDAYAHAEYVPDSTTDAYQPPTQIRDDGAGDYSSSSSRRPESDNMCQQCHQRPKYREINSRGQTVIHPYCGRTCANLAKQKIAGVTAQSSSQNTYQYASGGRKEIKFYDSNRPYYGFTNFSPHQVIYRGKVYPTSEHLFQAMKFIDAHPHIAERIRTGSSRPRSAFDEAHKQSRDVRPDWLHIRVSKMEEVLDLKFEQHPSLRRELLETGDAILIEDAGANDAFWGNGPDGNGRNELGKALMRLRAKLAGRR